MSDGHLFSQESLGFGRLMSELVHDVVVTVHIRATHAIGHELERGLGQGKGLLGNAEQ